MSAPNESTSLLAPPQIGPMAPKRSKSPKEAASAPKLDTFYGVFVPTSLNVLSILMFLRFGFILGQMGILGTLALLVLSYTIDMLTVMSVSAIATNGTVKGGGAYYMISRSIGPEFGGAIGIIFFVGQILNSSLNVVGFIEPLMVNFGNFEGDMYELLPVGYFWQVVYSTVLLFFCTSIALVGSKLVSKTALWLFMILVFSTLTIPLSTLIVKPFYPLTPPYDDILYTGPRWSTFKDNLWPHFTKGAAGSVIESKESFRDLFGIFFPATAGIFAGASMSGELKNPSKSIPQGTIKGLALTFVLYAIVIISMGAANPRDLLHNDIKVVQTVNVYGVIIILGELSTSLFSVIMGLVGSASLLTAISNDKIIPGLGMFADSKRSVEDKAKIRTRTILASWALAQIFLFADINQIATFITMAFLMTFIVTNLACFLLKIGSAPNFRPSFKYFSSNTALAGVIASGAAMFIVDGMSATIVIFLLMIFILLIHWFTPPARFGDISQLLIYHQVRKYLLRLKLNMSVKYWRPQILLLCDSPRSSWNLIGFCNHLKKGGLYVLGHVVILSDDTTTQNASEDDKEFSVDAYKEVKKQKAAWVKLRDMLKIKAFIQIALGPSLAWGVRNVYLGSGLGGMRPNITVLGFYDSQKYGMNLPLLPAAKNKSSLSNQLPTDSCREEQKVSINQWVQVIEDLIIMQSTVAVAANFGKLDLPQHEKKFFWDVQAASSSQKFIDLYPIQMSSISYLEDGKSVLSTNFDTYTLILQLGHILATVPEWKLTNHRLRVIVFVENDAEVKEEHDRLSHLLSTLRIDATIKAVCLNDGSLNSYNYIVKGYSKSATNRASFDIIDRALKHEQWWKNIVNARETLKEFAKQKLSRKIFKKSNLSQTAAPWDLDLGLNKTFDINPASNSLKNRRYTISNLHDKGVSLSLNMKAQGGSYFEYSSGSDSESDSEFDTDYGAGGANSSSAFASGAATPVQAVPDTKDGSDIKTASSTLSVAGSQISAKSSRANLRPNFLSMKIPQAVTKDDEEDEVDEGNDEDAKPSIAFADEEESSGDSPDTKPEEGTPVEKKPEGTDYFNLKPPKNVSRLKGEKEALKSPSIISNDDEIIQHMRTPQFLAVEDDDDIPSLTTSTTDLPALKTVYQSPNVPPASIPQSGSASKRNEEYSKSSGASSSDSPKLTPLAVTQKQLEKELKDLAFDQIPAKGQHLILNDLMKVHSPADQTEVIFSTLPAPPLNTHLDTEESFDYTNNLAIWLQDLPPTVLFNSQTVTVTTAL